MRIKLGKQALSFLRMKPKAIQLFLTVVFILVLAACSGEVNGQPEPRPASEKSIETGRQLMASYGCGSCHSIQGVPGANSTAGPPLKKFYERSYIAGRLPNTEENLVKWIENPQQFDPGNAMPNLGVREEEARAMAAYLYHRPTLFENLAR